jgi:hypothetical protein
VVADSVHHSIVRVSVIDGSETTLASGFPLPQGVALDRDGNVYVSDHVGNSIDEIPYAFVNGSACYEASTSGIDTLSPVLAISNNLLAVSPPSSDQSWLTINGVTNGAITIAFTANPTPGTPRSANLTVLGRNIPVYQSVFAFAPTLSGVTLLANGAVQFMFTNSANAPFTVVTSTNIAQPVTNWVPLGAPVEVSPGIYQFIDSQPGGLTRFYRVRSP